MPAPIPVSTIGFTQTTAEHFFARLEAARVRRVLDVRLRNTGQLAGFAKQPDLAWFCRRLAGADYVHEPALAPDEALMRAYRIERRLPWPEFETAFRALLRERAVEARLPPALFAHACLLCSEAVPHRCHRRLVCDYLNEHWGGTLAVTHL